ncbi:MAG: 3-deoxy-D-manno-octulosonic acid transferase [Alphaproteobacteria bacterium CG_4_10_14_0_8_um_filter_53_9]|nr:MAG: 3-deoxy-D-manno-octulosonic acid transferase [Alphaproteobacteria bacterium CG_4_10_14_0_8_um_filter_53_9]
MHTLYRALLILLSPLLALHVALRLIKGKEDKTRFGERLGNASLPRPPGPLVWLHGASVGEVTSLLPVLQALRENKPDINLLLTTGTRTGFATLHRLQPHIGGSGETLIQYVPLDIPFAVKRFMSHWKPSLSVFTESDFWPILLTHAPNPILLNGRISDRSWPRYQRFHRFFTPLISRFKLVLAQREEDALRLSAMGASNVIVGGNLKFDAAPLPADDAALEKLQATLGRRPLLVAASTHQGEEEIIAGLHNKLKAHVADLLTVIVPRHPHRGTQAVGAAMRHVRAVARRGTGETPHLGGPKHTDIYIADTLGELGLWYRLADVALIGGTLVKVGGHNPLEPLKLGTPTVTGPHMFNFKDMTPLLIEKKLITLTHTDAELATAILNLLQNPSEAIKQRTHIASSMPKLTGTAGKAARHILDLL